MFERVNKQQQKNLGKTCHITKPFRHIKFRILKSLKGYKNQKLPPFGKFITEKLFSEAAVHRCFSK